MKVQMIVMLVLGIYRFVSGFIGLRPVATHVTTEVVIYVTTYVTTYVTMTLPLVI